MLITSVWQIAQELPEYRQLADYAPPVTTRLYAGDGQVLMEYAVEKRFFVPEEKIPDLVKQAFISAEDKNFYHHFGVDFLGVTRAILTNLRHFGSNKRPNGASTITQQVAKNFLLSSELSYKRKIKEALLAFRIEQTFTKEHILELYLNEINFRAGGPNYSYTLNGTDLPALLVKGMLGGEIRPEDVSFTEGKTFVYEKVAWEEYIQGFMTRKELYAVISGADMKLLDNMDDPVPGKIFSRKIRLSLLKHRILRR